MPTTHYIWDVRNDCYLSEKDENGQLTAVYTNEPVPYGRLISQRRGGQTRYHHYDGQQSTRQLSDESGNVSDTATYTAFGKTVSKTGSSVNPFGYKGALGYYTNAETDDVYVRTRLYAPTSGRWIERDIFWESPNDYLYCLNEPLTRSDASGRLSYSTDQYDPNSCGQFRWDVKWGVPGIKQSGFIVQFMTLLTECCECLESHTKCGCHECAWNTGVGYEPPYSPPTVNGVPSGNKHVACKTTVADYTELWYVHYTGKRAIIYDQFCGKPNETKSDKDYWCFQGCTPSSLNRKTCGTASWIGTAVFVPLQRIDLDKYAFRRPSFAECLLSTEGHPDKAKLLAEAVGPAISRSLYSDWNCCGPSRCCWSTIAPGGNVLGKDGQGPPTTIKRDCESSIANYKCPKNVSQCRCQGRPIVLPSA